MDTIATTNTFDGLRRPESSASLGITNFTYYDAAGRLAGTVRQGTDGTTVSTGTAFDEAGRPISLTNALGGVTSISYGYSAGGQTTQTNTNPDGGTQIQVFYQEGKVQTNMGTAVAASEYVYGLYSDGGVSRPYAAQIKLIASNAATTETITNLTDMVGRNYKTLYADGSSGQSFYNSMGQLVAQTDPDNVTNLFQYNGKGEIAYRGMDLEGTGTPDFSGTDRITWTTNFVTSAHSATVARTRTYVFATNSSATPLLLFTVDASIEGLTNWTTDVEGLVTQSSTTAPVNGAWAGGR